jgi:hypothetical protein
MCAAAGATRASQRPRRGSPSPAWWVPDPLPRRLTNLSHCYVLFCSPKVLSVRSPLCLG